jgi:signal transduction histidine kinase
MKRWLRDTLGLRLFVLMWLALVLAQLLAFNLVRWNAGDRAGPRAPAALLALPLLPPTPGLPGAAPPPLLRAPSGGVRPDSPPEPLSLAKGPPEPPVNDTNGASQAGWPDSRLPNGGLPPILSRHGAPTLPTSALVLDYGVRLIVIALAAAFGARWLGLPMARLANASRRLASSLGRGPEGSLPLLDEGHGTVEVRDAAQVFNHMARELDTQFRARSLFVAALSHDLKTPLTRMRLRLESDPASPHAERSIADIHSMTTLVDTALDVFRGASGVALAHWVDVRALVQALVDNANEILPGRVVLEACVMLAHADPVALHRVVGNVLDNALRHGEHVHVQLDHDERKWVRIVIDDDGPGIPDTMLETVFEPFFRVDTSRSAATGGSGLGLYIARDLLRAMGGDIRLANRQKEDGGLGPLGLRAVILVPARPLRAALAE